MNLKSPNFWSYVATREGTVLNDGSFKYVILDYMCEMKTILRTNRELFTDTLKREGATMKVVVNGVYYELSRGGKVDALIGRAAPPSDSTIDGEVIESGKMVAGTAQSQRFFFAQFSLPSTKAPFWGYFAGFGDPPGGPIDKCGVGGAGPLVISGLRYGSVNQYMTGATGPATGDPGDELRKKLVQRSNLNFSSAEGRAPTTGKTILAASSSKQKLLIGAQPDGAAPGQSYAYLAEGLSGQGFDHAVFLDGSDSTTMMANNVMVVAPGTRKDDTMNLAIGFK